MGVRTVAEIVFWAGILALFYTYAGYPLLLAVVSRLRSRPLVRADLAEDRLPHVSIVITAYNEQRDLPAKLENTLTIDYPRDRLELIVASDCSSDRTDDIVREFAARVSGQLAVRLHRQAERGGKTAAQNAAVELVRGEIILFSDATTLYQPDVLRVMVRDFADPTVGCVAGRLLYVDPSQSNVGVGAQSYWGYETMLRHYESRIGSLIGVSGCLYAVRRSAYVPLPPAAGSDFCIVLALAEKGLRTIFEPDAICTEETHQRTNKEMAMRVRLITHAYGDLRLHRKLMNPLRYGFFAIQLLSHKVCRYLVPVFAIAILLASIPLAFHSRWYAVILGVQVWFYAMAALGWLLDRLGEHNRLLALPQYFVLVNLATLIAAYKYLRGERIVRWETVREPVPGQTAGQVAGASAGPAPGAAPAAGNSIAAIAGTGDRADGR